MPTLQHFQPSLFLESLIKKQVCESVLDSAFRQTCERATSVISNITPIKRPLRVVSLFSGCGGLDLGFQGNFLFLNTILPDLGYKIIWANDSSAGAVETYKRNVGRHIQFNKIESIDKTNLPQAEIVIGGFPCKDFSVSGSRAGTSGKHGDLYLQMRDVVSNLEPLCFIAENVSNIIRINDGKDFESIKSDFENAGRGYFVTYWNLSATDFGIAQTRKRVFIIGFRSDLGITASQVAPPPPIILERPVTSAEAIDDLRSNSLIPNQNQVSRAGLLDPTIRSQGDEAIRRDQPSQTIRATHHGRIQFHYAENRRITVREAARIQTFPDWFFFAKTMTDNYKQVGNAVPPVLAWHVAARVREILSEIYYLLPSPN